MGGSAETAAHTPSRRVLLLAGLLLAALAFLGLSRDLWTPDEPREAEMIREMYLAPSVIPTLDFSPFYEKPPIYYWLGAGLFALAGGPSVWAARLLSALCGLLTLLVLYRWGIRAASPSTGLVSVVMMATSSVFLYATHWIILDPLLMLWMTLAAWAGYELIAGGGRRYLVLFYAANLLALWTKGLVGPVLLGAGLLLYLAAERRRRPWRPFHPFWGAAVFLAGLGFLAAAITLAGGTRALYQWAWVNHVDRFLHPVGTGHAQPPLYYTWTLALAVLPWLVPLCMAFRPRFWRGRLDPDRPIADPAVYAAALVVGGLLILSLASTKREIYLLPLLPPLFLLMGWQAEELVAKAALPQGKGGALLWLQLALLALWTLALPAALLLYGTGGRSASLLLLGVGLICCVGLLASARRGRQRHLYGWASACAGAFCLALFFGAVPVIAAQKDMTGFIQRLIGRLPAGAPVYALGADETLRGIIPFVTGRRVIALPDNYVSETEPGLHRPADLLVQGQNPRQEQSLGREGYSLVESRTFGRNRTIALWSRPH
jgi:4-amino-4-deoxy-L-arabinose transferase-like glycosyltransferase